MTAIASALSHTFSETRVDADSLKTIAMFCAAGLAVSLLAAFSGLDLGAAFY
ncbi:MAG: hypothetical protein ABSG88_09955 [Bradyrhizobium sp.]